MTSGRTPIEMNNEQHAEFMLQQNAHNAAIRGEAVTQTDNQRRLLDAIMSNGFPVQIPFRNSVAANVLTALCVDDEWGKHSSEDVVNGAIEFADLLILRLEETDEDSK